jgi:glycosyltransferase involved in cell wall biosynthesis
VRAARRMRTPRVSIGLPVYNGENYLAETLDSILAQTFTDFEVIISDNASTDRTETICRQYAAQDRRIRYLRNTSNLGAAKNYNRVFELSQGEYFKWNGHDDPLAPVFLERCVAVLDRHPGVVLCFARNRSMSAAKLMMSGR